MANRSVFKIFGSIGPGGALVSLTEKICTAVYPAAYRFGDPEELESAIEKEIKKVREDYILELFKFKNKFIKQSTGNSDDKKNAYKKLVMIIKKFIEKMTRLEKNKYMRERIFYQREGQHVLYQRANAAYHDCKNEVTDNLVKQAKTICQPSQQEFKDYFEEFGIEDDAEGLNDDIAKKIDRNSAQNFHQTWLKIQSDHSKELNRLRSIQDNPQKSEEDQEKISQLLNMSQEDEAQFLKDRLFIETGEDVEDIFVAFAYHKLL